MPDASVVAEESARLRCTLSRLDRAITRAEEALARREADYQEVKRYMVERRGELDPAEMFQNELLLRDVDSHGHHAMRYRDRLLALRPSPYFGRIDFETDADVGRGLDTSGCEDVRADGSGDGGAVRVAYLGRTSFRDDDGIAVLDWRSPFASMFYDADVGPAAYDSPAGPVRGYVRRKRQITVTEGALESVVDTDQTVRDDLLRRELGKAGDPAMRSIIATIQREQNAAIRNETDRVVVVQGVAGSGKTAIALHRIAYLLYRHRGALSADRVAILSPHSVFSDYVAHVLPELGEEPILTLSAATIAAAHAGPVRFSPEPDLLDDADPASLLRARLTSSSEFLGTLDVETARLVARCFEPVDCALGRHRLDADWLAARYASLAPRPVMQRLDQMSRDLVDRWRGSLVGPPPPRPSDVRRRLAAMLSIPSALALYRQACGAISADLVPAPGPRGRARELAWADVFGYLFARHRFDGLVVQDGVHHLVIDEMQDYTPTQLAVIDALYPCPKTVLGDVGQGISPVRRSSLAEVTDVLGPARVIELRRSYRSTAPIMRFAGAVAGGDAVETIGRDGPEPARVACTDADHQVRVVAERAAAHLSAGAGTCAVIARSTQHARSWHAALLPHCPVMLVEDGGPGLSGGVSVLSVRTAKGLEFDEVVVVDVDADRYATELDRRLLYVACTRALHRLTVTWVGTASGHVAATP